MLASTVRQLRRRRAWSQAHLAEAAGLSVRTVQRIERGAACSDETLLALAAAFDVDVETLTCVRPPEADGAPLRAHRLCPRQAAGWGAVLAAPSLLFVASNVLKYELGVPLLYDALAGAATATGWNALGAFLLHPAMLLGGPLAAVALVLMAQVHVRTERTRDGLALRGLDLAMHGACAGVLVTALAALGILVGYVAVENAADWVIALTAR